MELGKGTKVFIIILSVAICAGAVIWNGQLEQQSPYAQIVDMLRQRGYTLTEDDLYNAGSFSDTSIAEILAGEDLSEAVEHSRASGFPADINAVGDIQILLLTMQNGDIITIFTRDGSIELCFVQRLDSTQLAPLS